MKAEELAGRMRPKKNPPGSCSARSMSARRNTIRPKSNSKKRSEPDPKNAAVLNYYGYMLADRGVRLEEATDMIHQRARTGTRQRRLSRQHGLGVLQAEQARRSRRIFAEGGGPLRRTIRRFSAIWAMFMRRWAGPKRAAALWEKALARMATRAARPITKPTSERARPAS